MADGLAPEAVISIVVAVGDRVIPIGIPLLIAFVALAFIFGATTMDSAAYALSSVATAERGEGTEPARWHRVFWAVMLTVVSLSLMFVGGKDSLSALQSASVNRGPAVDGGVGPHDAVLHEVARAGPYVLRRGREGHWRRRRRKMTRSCSILVTFLRETDARGGRKTMKIALIVACLLAVPCAAVAQDGRIAGTVTDATGGILPGVTVVAAGPWWPAAPS